MKAAVGMSQMSRPLKDFIDISMQYAKYITNIRMIWMKIWKRITMIMRVNMVVS